MALYKRGKTWWMNFWFDGYHVQKSTKCKNKRDAETVERAYQTQLAKREVGIEPKKKAPTFRQAMKDYLAWLKVEHGDKTNTVNRYESNSKILIKFFGDALVDKVSTEMVEKFKTWRCSQRIGKDKRKLAPATINHELYFLKMFFKRLVGIEILIKNPASKMKCLPVANEQTRSLSRSEQRLYLMACSQPLQDVAALMIETGMRPSEVLNLKSGDVDLEKNFLQVREGKTQSARRKIPLSNRARTVLMANISRKNELVFPGQTIHKLDVDHRKAVKDSGIIYCRLYDLRHTFATLHTENQTDVVTLASLLGHKNLKMIMRYAHPSESHKAEAIRRMEERVAKAV